MFQLKSRFAVVCLAFRRTNWTLYLWQVITSASCQASSFYRALPVPAVASIALLPVFGSRCNPVADNNICPAIKHSQTLSVQAKNLSLHNTHRFCSQTIIICFIFLTRKQCPCRIYYQVSPPGVVTFCRAAA